MKLIDITGKAISGEWGNDCEDGNGIPVLRTTNFTDTGVINFANVVLRDIPTKDLSKKFLRPGDIIIEKSGGSDTKPVGRVVYFDSEENKYLINNFTGLLRVVDQTKWYPRYVFYALFANYSFGGTRQYENKTTGLHNLKLDQYLNSFDIPDVDFQLQHHIADTLDKVSEGIEVCRRILGELDLMVKAKFGEMFGDPVSNEREWNVETLNDVCTEIGDGLHGTPEYDDNGEYPFINGNNLINGAIEITPATKKVNAEIYKKHYIGISANALLLSINGTLGKLAFYNGEKVMLGKSACYCNFKPEINRAFVYGVMKTEAFAGFLEKSATASTIKNVGLKAIRGYKLIMPPQALQMQFIEFSNQVDKSKLAVKQSLEKLETLKKSLMQEYLG